jgi:hypothetical protein
MSEERNIQESDKEQGTRDKSDELAIDIKHLANEPPHAESEISTEISNPKSGISKSEIENMEVHKHPHHITQRKKWGEYFLEFLMIFLAVTLGFFAETIRENITEHTRAKVFAASMLKDLENDTSRLVSYRKYFDYAAKNVDTFMQLLTVNEPKDIPAGKLYWYGLWGGAHAYFIPNDATFQQMKSSGSLRYFEKTAALEVAKYDRFCRLMQANDEMSRDIYAEVRKSRALIFDFQYNDIANNISQSARIKMDQERLDSFLRSNPPLLSYDKTLFNQYVELIRSRFMRTNVTYADSLLFHASVLITELRKEYHLE